MLIMDYRKINFGKADAKDEGCEYPDLLINGYLDATGVIDLALYKSTFLFLGYKGAGKTALLEHIRLTGAKYNVFVNDVPLAEFPYKSLAKIIEGVSETEAKLPIAWDWLLLIYVINSFTRDETLRSNSEWDETLRVLQKVGILPVKNISDIVSKSAKRSFRVNLLPYFEFAFENDDSIQTANLTHLVSFLKKILENTTTTNQHYIIIDGLDEILTSRDIQYQSIAALVNQAKTLNIYFRTNNIPIKIIILCRTDLFERLPHPNKNKIRQDAAYEFDWFDESSVADYSHCNLIKLANLRGKLVYPSLKDIFSELFPPIYEEQPTYQTLLEYTRHTPRDFLQLLKKIQEYCGSRTVSVQDIEKGIKKYSMNYFLPEIKDELVGYLDNEQIEKFVNLLSSYRKREFYLREIRIYAQQNSSYAQLNLEYIFNILFECSAIGHLIGMNNLFYIKYRNRNMCFNPNERIRLHKGLWKSFTA